MKKNKICLLGAGRMAYDHAQNIYESPYAELFGIYDPLDSAAQKMSDTYQCKIYGSTKEVFSDPEIDGVAIVSPSNTHSDLILEACDAEKGIFCEKPIDLDVRKIETCRQALEKSKVPFLLGFNRRFDPHHSVMEERIQLGEIGSVEYIHITSRDCPFPPLAYIKTSGGLFHDMTIHDFDMARWLLKEEVTEVYTTGSCLIEPELQDFQDVDTACVILKTQSGKICSITNSRRAVYGHDQRIEVFGSKGMLQSENVSPTYVRKFSEDGVQTDKPLQRFLDRYKNAYKIEMEHFLKDVMNGKPSKVSAFDGLQANVIADAVKASLLESRPMKISY